MVTYGTTTIPSDQITVQAGGTVAISAAFDNSIGLIGGYDSANGSATGGTVVTVDSPSDAQNKFGDESELYEAVKLAFDNGAATVKALPVTETAVTGEDPSSGTSGELANAPVMDPNIHDEHDITDQNGNTVNVSYEVAAETVSGTEAYVNPVNGNFKGDGNTTYLIDYTYGDYSTAELTKMVDESPRIVCALTENETVLSDLVGEINSTATDFDFMHAVGGAVPAQLDGDTATSTEASNYASNYSDSQDERRLSLVAAPRGYIDDDNVDMERTASAVGGYLASLPLGISATNDSISGFQTLRTPLQPSDAGNLIDEQVLPLIDYPPITIAKDMTTSTEPKFERVYAMQVIDEATEASHLISREFVGDQNTVTNRAQLATTHRNTYNSFRSDSPPLLDEFTVSVRQDSIDENKVNVEIGLDVVDVMDTIDMTITVGDIIRNGGAS
jgi:hypothetical protein